MRLIDADELKDTLRELGWFEDDGECYTSVIEDIIDEQPIVDVFPVVHAHWVEYPKSHIFKCSNCKLTIGYKYGMLINGERKYKGCPRCLAVMDGSDN